MGILIFVGMTNTAQIGHLLGLPPAILGFHDFVRGIIL